MLLREIDKSNWAVRSASVADFFGSALETESGAAYTTLLERDGDSLLCLARDSAVVKPRVARRLTMMEDSGQR